MAGITADENGTILWVDDEGDAFEVFEDEDGDYVIQDDEGDSYVVNDAINAAIAENNGDASEEPQQGYTQEELDAALDHELDRESSRRGRPLTASEEKRFIEHISKTGEMPKESDWRPFNLDNENDRADYWTERALETAPTEPYSSKNEQPQTANEEGE
jgi:hypothetical protein